MRIAFGGCGKSGKFGEAVDDSNNGVRWRTRDRERDDFATIFRAGRLAAQKLAEAGVKNWLPEQDSNLRPID